MQNINQKTNQLPKKRQLLFRLSKKDFELEFFCAGGNGGQNVNKVATACRIHHPASGAVAKAQEHRTQLANKKTAFERLVKTPEFQKWHKIQCAKSFGAYIDIDKWVEDNLHQEKLKVEIRVNDKWTEISWEDIKPDELQYEDLED